MSVPSAATAIVPLSLEDLPVAGTAGMFSLTVAPHETVALLGEDDGVGRIGGWALGLEPCPGGRIRVFGTVLADLEPDARLAFRRRVGYLPAGDALLQNLSLADNVALPLRFGSGAPAREIDGRVRVMLAAVRVADVAQRRPAQVTDEDRRRTALARAMAFDPALLILEQPFEGLTARAAGELLEVARGGEVAEGGRRSILITGQELPLLLARRCTRVYRLSKRGTVELETV